ncbi:hypothetical protein NECAME_17005 [Necator americanus]|uniref:Uncharacterized protein n=1 Tax=Necator americanus TaxID=51031 RepID=W2TRW3_NECAM|nr:hypothetical protein NECAME_17005 [Necator americanus]ETN84780.1 hypothetical protein NECAME_17005 [Necator americanus]
MGRKRKQYLTSNAVCAAKPDREKEPNSYEAVTTHMIHGKCGAHDPLLPSETIDPNDTDLCERAILAPMNLKVRQLNSDVLERLCRSGQQDERVYRSVDEGLCHKGSSDELHAVEYPNSLEPTRMPAH